MPGVELNVFALIILVALFLDYSLGMAANILNLKALVLEVPGDLDGVYKPEDYRRSQEYTRVATRFGFVTGTFTLVVTLSFWFAGGFAFLDGLVRGWGLPTLINGLLYIGILLAGYGLLTIPFSIYHTFVLEQRFGFNRTTAKTFLLDRLKGLGLALVLGVPLMAAALALLEYAGSYAWLYVWATVTVVSFIVQFVAPVWIMPLFNKFTPMPAGELRDAILDYARSVDFPVKNVFVVDSSRRSSRSNAFFTGFGRNKRIALFDTLIQQHTVPEIVAVLAHEIGHYKKKHVLQGTVMGVVQTGIVLFLLSVFLRSTGLYAAFAISQPSVYTGLVFFGLLYTPLHLVLSVVLQAISRRNESAADRFAAATVKERSSLADALKKLSANNLSNLTPHPFYVFLSYSHPPLLQRVRAILT